MWMPNVVGSAVDFFAKSLDVALGGDPGPDAVGASKKLSSGPVLSAPEGASGEAGVGNFRDGAGDAAYGAWVEGQIGRQSGDLLGSSTPVAGEEPGAHSYFGYESSLADGSLGAKTTNKSAQLSAQASGPTFSLTGGTRGTDRDSDAKFGLSPFGPGGGLRLHYGDADGDKLREYGFGLDLGVVSCDFKTEDPLGKLFRGFPGVNDPEKNYTQAAADLFHHFAD